MAFQDWDSMSEKWTRASFRVITTSIAPTDITEQLAMEPTEVSERPTRPRAWILDSGLRSARSAEEHIEALLEKLRPHEAALHGLDADHLEVFLGFSSDNGQGGMVIDARLLGELARLGIDLVLDLYPPESME
jgi:Domain of unknown function (DUF4279)